MTKKFRVLVVDDERLSRQTAVHQLKNAGFEADAVENAYRALEHLEGDNYDVVLCDLRMPGMDGLELLDVIRRDHPDLDALIMTAYGTVETAVSAMQRGAADYLTKPFHFEELEHRLRKLRELREYRKELESLRALLESGAGRTGLVGGCAAMQRVVQRVLTFAEHSSPVLITGETGTGKELAARALHKLGPRAREPFVAVACGAIPATLAESELFGHERGSFTGATTRRSGAFERAHRGTLLLDDVDDLPLDIQASLLRALQEGTFMRVGGSRDIRVDVRVVTTTKVDLSEAAAQETFRDDLLYRLRGLEIRLPPLRERGDDILLLAQHFLRASAPEGPEKTLAPAAATQLRSYSWPGNVRELRHSIDSAAVVCEESVIRAEHLPDHLRDSDECQGELVSLNCEGRDSLPFAEVVKEVEDRLIQWAMAKAGGQQTRAAEILGLPRTTFQSKLTRS